MPSSTSAVVDHDALQHVAPRPDVPRPPQDDADDARTDLIRKTVSAVAAACSRRAVQSGAHLRGFRVVAVRCASQGVTLDEARDTVRLYAQRPQVLLLARGGRPDLCSIPPILRAREARHRVADDLVERIDDELVAGYAAVIVRTTPEFEHADALRSALNDHPGDLSGPDPDALRAVALLFGWGADIQRRLDLAGEDAAILVPGAVDLGPVPFAAHRRVVFAGWSVPTWREASEILVEIGDRYDLALRTTVPVRGLRQLGAAYRELIDGLPPHSGVTVLSGRQP